MKLVLRALSMACGKACRQVFEMGLVFAKNYFPWAESSPNYLSHAESSSKDIYRMLSHRQNYFMYADSAAKNAQHALSTCFRAGWLIFKIFCNVSVIISHRLSRWQKLFPQDFVTGKNYLLNDQCLCKNL